MEITGIYQIAVSTLRVFEEVSRVSHVLKGSGLSSRWQNEVRGKLKAQDCYYILAERF